MSKSAVHAGSRRFRRVTKSGKLIMARRQAPHMAGQVRQLRPVRREAAGSGRMLERVCLVLWACVCSAACVDAADPVDVPQRRYLQT
jgi:hypothetical protein